MGLRVWYRGEIFSKNMNKKLRAHKAPPIKTKVKRFCAMQVSFNADTGICDMLDGGPSIETLMGIMASQPIPGAYLKSIRCVLYVQEVLIHFI